PAASTVKRSPRLVSSANSFRRCSFLICLLCAASDFQAASRVRGLLVVFMLVIRFSFSTLNGFACPFIKPALARSGPFGTFPQANSSKKRVVVVAGATTRRELFQFLNVASAQHHFARFDGCNQTFHDIGHMMPPFFLAIFLQSPNPDVVFKGGLLVRQVPQFHRLDDTVHDKG